MNRSKAKKIRALFVLPGDRAQNAGEGNYVAALLAQTRGLQPGTVTQVIVKHDHWCALLAHGGVCDCEPEIHMEPVELEAKR